MSPLRELKKREYAGAIVIFTTPHIWGTAADLEGAFAAGVVVREPESGDNERDIPNLDEILKDAGIAGVAGVDTRELTKLASSGSHTAEIKPIAA
jgi:carbamoyl-phosphate synthase small subunit